MRPKDARNSVILAAHFAGEKHGRIAELYGITRQRVSFIVRRAGHGKGAGRPKLPEMDAETLAHYVKLRGVMGSTYARQAMGLACK